MNMWVDSGTKLMDNSAMRKVLRTGEWTIAFNTEFTKQTSKGKKASDVVQLLPGRGLEVRDEQLMEHVRNVAESPGWHFRDYNSSSLSHLTPFFIQVTAHLHNVEFKNLLRNQQRRPPQGRSWMLQMEIR